MQSGRKILIIILSIWGMWGLVATTLLIARPSVNDTTTEPTTADEQNIVFPSFPLQCPSDAPINVGPTWRNVTIGTSQLSDLVDIYGVQFHLEEQPQWVTGEYAPAYGVLLTLESSQERELPQAIDVCIVDGVILALSMSLPQDGTFPTGYIDEWVTQYGIPETVAWIGTGTDWCSRIVVWSQEGIAAEFDVSRVEDNPNLAWTGSITLFPFAQSENYLSEWPHNALNYEPPTSNNLNDCPTEQNPFDF